MTGIASYVWIAVLVLLVVNGYFIIRGLLDKSPKVCPICGGKLRKKKKCKISDKGYMRGTYYFGTVTEYMFIRCCADCGYEIWPEKMDDREAWRDA